MLKKTDIVIFDFDGTLFTKYAGGEFAKYCFKRSIRPWFFLPLIIVAAMVHLFNPQGMWWRENIRRFLTPKMVKKFAPDFIKRHKIRRFAWSKKRVATEHKKGNKVVLISAGPNYLIPYLVDDMAFDAVICSKVKPLHPWKYDFFCLGQNKVTALDAWAKKNKIIPHVVRSYGDSVSDTPVMNLAKEKIWVNRKTGQTRRVIQSTQPR